MFDIQKKTINDTNDLVFESMMLSYKFNAINNQSEMYKTFFKVLHLFITSIPHETLKKVFQKWTEKCNLVSTYEYFNRKLNLIIIIIKFKNIEY